MKKKILSLIGKWSQISLYGIFAILSIISGLIVFDLLSEASFGYAESDLALAGLVGAFALLLFLLIKGIIRFVERR